MSLLYIKVISRLSIFKLCFCFLKGQQSTFANIILQQQCVKGHLNFLLRQLYFSHAVRSYILSTSFYSNISILLSLSKPKILLKQKTDLTNMKINISERKNSGNNLQLTTQSSYYLNVLSTVQLRLICWRLCWILFVCLNFLVS